MARHRSGRGAPVEEVPASQPSPSAFAPTAYQRTFLPCCILNLKIGGYYESESDGVGTLTNNGRTLLSGRGIRAINGNVTNNGEFKTENTNTYFAGNFANNTAFMNDSTVNMFTDLSIGGNGSMAGDAEDLWYVCNKFEGVKIEDDVVKNIFGPEGMYVFYSPFVAENSYLDGMTYNLTGGGKLVPTLTPKCPKLVQIDIKPGTYPNDINLKSKGVVPIAILTTADFDPISVDPGTVVFGETTPVRWTRADVDNDGDIDLLFQEGWRVHAIALVERTDMLTPGYNVMADWQVVAEKTDSKAGG